MIVLPHLHSVEVLQNRREQDARTGQKRRMVIVMLIKVNPLTMLNQNRLNILADVMELPKKEQGAKGMLQVVCTTVGSINNSR